MRNRVRVLGVIAFMLIIPALVQAQPRMRTEKDRKLDILKLFQKKGGCPSEAVLRSFGSDADSLMTDMINNPQLSLKYRLYAVDCMAYFRNKRSDQVLSSLLNDPTWDRPFVHRAMYSYARAFGGEALIHLKPFLQKRAPATRAAAVRAIGFIGTSRAISLLKRVQLMERDLLVLQAIDEVLQKGNKSP
jgi:hypothetical protein